VAEVFWESRFANEMLPLSSFQPINRFDLARRRMSLRLSDFHREQLAKYVRFFRQKREVQVQEVNALFNDAKEARLDGESLLGPDEVQEMLRGLCDSVRSNVAEDLRLTVNMSVLAIQQLFEDADRQSLELEIDTSRIEDKHLIEEVEKMRLEAPTTEKAQQKAGRLVSLRDEQQLLVDQNAQLEEQIRLLKAENVALQDECDRSKQQLSNYNYQVESLSQQLEAAVVDGSSHEESKASGGMKVDLQAELDRERDAVVKLRAELADAREMVLEKHGVDIDDLFSNIRNSKQFQQLRKTLSQKTEQLTDLRRRMLKYEPDEGPIEKSHHK